jgi:hypothetical protein
MDWTSLSRSYSDDELKLNLFSQSLTNITFAWYKIYPAE